MKWLGGFFRRFQRRRPKTVLAGKASDLIFQCTRGDFPCPRGIKVRNPLRRKKAIRKCWGCRYLVFTTLGKKLKR